jgi:hypothetical protein
MDRAEQRQAFIAALEELLVKRPDGKVELHVDRLRALVRAHPEFTLAAGQAYAKMAPQFRGHAQIARALGAAYYAEFDDDSLDRAVRRDLEAAGLGEVSLTVENPPGSPPSDSGPKVVFFTVDGEALKQADIYQVTRIFAVTPGEPGQFSPSNLRGRVVLQFDSLNNDPREVWHIPEARAFMTKLFEAMPYLPYYLHADPRLGTAHLLFGCMASEDAFDEEDRLDFGHPSVVGPVVRSLRAVIEMAEQLGDTPDAALAQALSIHSEAYVTWLRTKFQLND